MAPPWPPQATMASSRYGSATRDELRAVCEGKVCEGRAWEGRACEGRVCEGRVCEGRVCEGRVCEGGVCAGGGAARDQGEAEGRPRGKGDRARRSGVAS